ncbi:MAG TPA: cell division protein ZipA C-terminal FtsZ-binding domain-containing protein [Steroidobacteraceae bacterium]|nr:cell division protein ZipA C-terminal FtsZ-binding domain-containing protein [Steroidobacteraceae bacterium]
MSELRWALLILGILFVVALALWERRRPRQASSAFERFAPRDTGSDAPVRLVRDPPLTLPEVHAREPLGRPELPTIETSEESAVPLLEPAEEHFEADMEPPLRDPAQPHEPPAAVPPAHATDEDTIDDLPTIILGSDERVATAEESAAPSAAAEPRSELPAAGAPVVEWPAENERRILALRLVAPQRERFAGRSLRQALAAEGFLLGQFAIFHKADDERRAVLSAASLTRPGTFDMDTMDSQHYGGLSLFAVLPGGKPAGQAFEELVFAARNLNERLHGVLQDEQGTPLTPSRIAQLREELRTGAGS